MNKYIIASCKDWHKSEYDKFSSSHEGGSWHYVSSPEELGYVLGSVEPTYIFFLHWSWRVPGEIISKFECVCFHMTDVPYGRGGTPLQNLIINHQTKTMISALRMTEEIDAGPVYKKIPMGLQGRAQDIYLRAGKICWEIIDWIIKTRPTPNPQVGDVVTFERRKPEQSVLPNAASLSCLYDHIRMLDAPGYPHAFLNHGNLNLQFTHAELSGEEVHAKVVFRRNKELGEFQ